MARSEANPGRKPFDWRGWLAVAWALWFGALYVRMVLQARAPGVLRAVETMLPGSS